MESGVYEPNNRLTVQYWEPGTDVPDGFKNFRSYDGTDNFIKADRYGDPIRSADGLSVASIVEGGALVTDAGGNFYTVAPEDIDDWSKTVVEVESSTPAKPSEPTPSAATGSTESTTGTAPDPSAQPATATLSGESEPVPATVGADGTTAAAQ